MKTTSASPEDLRGVFAVPPLARSDGGRRSLDLEQNDLIVRHIAAGGITRFIYGGNAFLYHVTLAEYEQLLDWLSGFTVCVGIKYAVVRDDPARDDYLDGLLKRVDRRFVISGIGERPAVTHLRDWRVAGFTTGSGCIAPVASARQRSRVGESSRAVATAGPALRARLRCALYLARHAGRSGVCFRLSARWRGNVRAGDSLTG